MSLSQFLILIILLIYFCCHVPTAFIASRDYSSLSVESSDLKQVVQSFFDYISGNAPDYTPYGLSLTLVYWVIMLPILMVASLFRLKLSFSDFLISFKLFQILLSSASFYIIFHLIKLKTSSFWAILGAIYGLSSYCISYWVVFFKPDIWLLFFSLSSIFFQTISLKEIEKNKIKTSINSFFIGVLLCGLAIGSKLWGIFLLPGTCLCGLLICLKSKLRLGQCFKFIILAFWIFLISIFISMPHFFLKYNQIKSILTSVNSSYNSIPTLEAIYLLFPEKIQLLTSWQFMGIIIFPLFLACTALLMLQMSKSRKILTELPILEITYCITALFHLLVLYKDTFNIKGGERNIITLYAFTIVVSFSILGLYLQKRSLFITTIVKSFLILPIGFYYFGGLVFNWRPIPTVIHKDTYKSIKANLNSENILLIDSLYSNNADVNQFKLKSDINDSKYNVLKDVFYKLGVSIIPKFEARSYAQTWPHFVYQHLDTEKKDRYAIRPWVQKNVPNNSLILIEYYLDLYQDDLCFNEDIRKGSNIKSNRVNPSDLILTSKALNEMKPDWAFTLHREVAKRMANENSNYRIYAQVGESVFVLKRNKN